MDRTRRSAAFLCALSLLAAFASVSSPAAAKSPPSPAQSPARQLAETTSADPATLTITAVGDICFASAPGRLIAAHGPRAPFASVASYLRDSDITLGNLECTLSRRGTPVPGKAFTFRGSPRAIEGLQYAGFDVVALGNNHARDYGASALLDTVKYLDQAGIAHAGAGVNSAKAYAPAVLHSKDTTVAYLSYSQIGPADFSAGKHRAGTAYTFSLSRVKADVRAAKKYAKYVIVGFHWGIEYDNSPTATQVRFGHGAIDAGADLVISEHPHVIQGVEFYRHKLIAYSLGNFVFSPGGAPGHDVMVLRVTMGPQGISKVTARPAHIGDDGAPSFATGTTARRILALIARTSRGRGSKVSVHDNVATIRP